MIPILPNLFPRIHADAEPTPPSASIGASRVVETVKSVARVQEPEIKRWRRTFDANAKTVVDGERYLERDQFVNAIAPSGDLTRIGRAQFAILFRIANGAKRERTLLKCPDAVCCTAFQYFDVDGSEMITFDEFKNVFTANVGPHAIPFDFDCDCQVKLYLGKKDGTHVLGYNEFTQLMKGLQGERLRQAFKYLDDNQDGFIRPDQFKRIILEIAGHKLSDAPPTLTTLTPEMVMVERVIRESTAKSKDGRINQTDFLNHASFS
ncbi:EF-hand [Artomyces pyxidatus]|uniref:EF-hand n=1 Tax=Artomyces pyxidatus TaxID=48021 RepID=A0ACB8SIC3_9AGAM|nr:EF-hand [Artomyces pyxidatus]